MSTGNPLVDPVMHDSWSLIELLTIRVSCDRAGDGEEWGSSEPIQFNGMNWQQHSFLLYSVAKAAFVSAL
jgi:hypothetical protein